MVKVYLGWTFLKGDPWRHLISCFAVLYFQESFCSINERPKVSMDFRRISCILPSLISETVTMKFYASNIVRVFLCFFGYRNKERSIFFNLCACWLDFWVEYVVWKVINNHGLFELILVFYVGFLCIFCWNTKL